MPVFSKDKRINSLITFCISALAAMIMWYLCDMVWCALFHEEFHYSFQSHILPPLVFALVITVVTTSARGKQV